MPADVDTDLAAHVLIGPVVFAVLSGRDELADVVDFTVDRFLASYRGPVARPSADPTSPAATLRR